MIEITTDRRRIEAEPDEGAHARAVASGRRLLAVRIDLARDLCRIDVTKTYVAHDCVSIEEYGVRFLSMAGREARELVDLGHSLGSSATPKMISAMGSAATPAATPAAATSESATEAVNPADGDGATAGTPASDAEPGGTAEPGGMAEPGGTTPPALTVADAILAGAISVERAAAAGRLVATPDLLRDGEDPVALAMTGSMRDVRTTIRVREEELAQKEAVVPLALAVTERARDGFRRARSLASERADAMLTEGETFAVVVEHYLDAFDLRRRGEGTRRVPDTSELPGQRYIPAQVKRAVRERAGDQCEVPGCPRRTFLEYLHVTAHRDGGSREEENLLLGCGGHHVLFDAGRIRLLGWDEGHPVLCDARGRRLEDRTASMVPTGATGATGARTPGAGAGRAPVEVARGDSWELGGSETGQVAERPPPVAA